MLLPAERPQAAGFDVLVYLSFLFADDIFNQYCGLGIDRGERGKTESHFIAVGGRTGGKERKKTKKKGKPLGHLLPRSRRFLS